MPTVPGLPRRTAVHPLPTHNPSLADRSPAPPAGRCGSCHPPGTRTHPSHAQCSTYHCRASGRAKQHGSAGRLRTLSAVCPIGKAALALPHAWLAQSRHAQTHISPELTRGRSASSAPWRGSCVPEGWAAPCAASRRPGSGPARSAPACKAGGGAAAAGRWVVVQPAAQQLVLFLGCSSMTHTPVIRTSLLCALVVCSALRRPWRRGR